MFWILLFSNNFFLVPALKLERLLYINIVSDCVADKQSCEQGNDHTVGVSSFLNQRDRPVAGNAWLALC